MSLVQPVLYVCGGSDVCIRMEALIPSCFPVPLTLPSFVCLCLPPANTHRRTPVKNVIWLRLLADAVTVPRVTDHV